MDETVVIERGMPIPRGEGSCLRADIYRSAGGQARPTLLQYTAYNKSNWGSVYGVINPVRAVENGFVVVVVDALSRFASDGESPYRPFFDDGAEVSRCIRWITAQS